MPIEQLTTKPTEGDLEAEIHHALRVAFPWIPASDLRHQTKFSFKFGRAVVDVDGAKASHAEARADVIVYTKNTPLAVLELKRAGKAINAEDVEQGLSYARMLNPRPPLVVVTSGSEVRLLETHTGQEWKPASASETELARLIEAASRAASVDTKDAVQVLLGTGSQVWVTALRKAAEICLGDLSGAWDQPLLPFVQNFLIPREATQEVLAALRHPNRVVIVEGPPLVGKSSALRELAVKTVHSDDLVVLFIEADGDAGHGIFQRLANILAAALAWTVSRDEVRTWLRRISNSGGPALVLAIDGVGPDNDEVRRDIEELSSSAYGNKVRIVISLDDTVVRRLTLSASGRKSTVIGRAAVKVEVKPLNDAEFGASLRALWEHRISFVPGAHAAAEMRTPWILRAVVAGVSSEPEHKNEGLTAVLAPMLGLNLIDYARERFKDPELHRKSQQVARAVLEDSIDRTRPIGLILESVGLFMVRNKTLETVLERADIDSLIAIGLLKPGTHVSGDAILLVRLPELLASELALLLANELENRSRTDVQAAAAWLSDTSKSLPLGDIVAAQAIYDAARRGGITLDFINALLNGFPREEVIRPGTKFAMHLPGVGIAQLTFQEDGSLTVLAGGQQHVIPLDDDEQFGSMLDLNNWLILSHLVARPFMIQSSDGKIKGRIDPGLLLELGTCQFVLRGPQNDPAKSGVLTHSVPGHGNIVCHKSGIVEPVTMAIYGFLGSNGPSATEWIDEAIERASFPLLCRVDIALRQLVDSNDHEKASWAKKMIEEVVKPELEKFPLLH